MKTFSVCPVLHSALLFICAVVFEITDLAAPANVGLELLVLGTPPPSIGTVSDAELDSFEGPKPIELPAGSYAGSYALVASTAVGSIDEATLTPGEAPFEYATAALISTESTFTVPEPGAFAAGLAALESLAGVRRCSRDPALRARPRRPSSAASTPRTAIAARAAAARLGSGISVSV